MRHASILVLLLGVGCDNSNGSTSGEDSSADTPGDPVPLDQGDPVDTNFEIETITELTQPWAMTFLPDGQLLVTQKTGEMLLVTQSGEQSPISGVPDIAYGGQGGLGDVILHPDFEDNGFIYLSYATAGGGSVRGAAVARMQLDVPGRALSGLEVIWQQDNQINGAGHYGHRMVFDDDGYLFISSGDRQMLSPAQDTRDNLGAIVRLNDDGSVPSDNPFASEGGETAQIWSYGHRNPLGLALDAEGVLWEHEMGPRGGDEFQRIEMGQNYGWPTVSNGDHYDGRDIPDHSDDDEFRAPEESWNPSISPAGLIIYTGELFPSWRGKAIMGGLSGEAIIWVTFACAEDGRDVCEAAQYDMGTRIREVEQGPDGAVWLLEDERNNVGGRLLKLTPN
ncbi:MAG: PQQ-dependent sugar dehydrogenase [Myxococcota bacterium]